MRKYFAGSGCSPEKISKASTSTKMPNIPAFTNGSDSSFRIHSFGVDFRRLFEQAKPFLTSFLRFELPNISLNPPQLALICAERLFAVGFVRSNNRLDKRVPDDV